MIISRKLLTLYFSRYLLPLYHGCLFLFILQSNVGFSASGGIRPFQLQNWKQKVSWTKKAEFIRTAEKLKNQ